MPGRRHTPTLKEVAERAGVSVAAVSYVVNDRAEENRISPECIGRIRAAARELGYEQNYHARSLPTGTSYTLGLVLGEKSLLGYPFWTRVAAGADSAARAQGYSLLLLGRQQEKSPLEMGLHCLRTGRVDGLITYRRALEVCATAEQAIADGFPIVTAGPAASNRVFVKAPPG